MTMPPATPVRLVSAASESETTEVELFTVAFTAAGTEPSASVASLW